MAPRLLLLLLTAVFVGFIHLSAGPIAVHAQPGAHDMLAAAGLTGTPLQIAQKIIGYGQQLASAAATVKANPHQASKLNARVQAILPYLTSLGERQQKQSQVDLTPQLQALLDAVTDSLVLVKEFQGGRWWEAVLYHSSYSKRFSALSDRLQQAQEDLHFGLEVAQIFERAGDASDLRLDLQLMQAQQSKMVEMMEQHHMAQADRHASLKNFNAAVIEQMKEVHAAVERAIPAMPSHGQLIIPLSELQIEPKPLGGGGFGDVYRALWLSRDLTVAVKKLRLRTMDKGLLDDFHREAHTLWNLRFEQVVNVYGISVDETVQSYLIVMEWMPQGSLHDHFRNALQEQNLTARLKVALQCSRAVNHLHQLQPPHGPILHRDIKSLNFLLGKDGIVKIADFGLARVRKAINVMHSAVKELEGTPLWMAPELWTVPHHPTMASDVYALAITVWEVLEGRGRTWIDFTSLEELARAIEKGQRPNLSSAIPADLSALLQKGWHADPLKRPSSWQFLQGLKIILVRLAESEGEGPSFAPQVEPTPLVKPFAVAGEGKFEQIHYDSGDDAYQQPDSMCVAQGLLWILSPGGVQGVSKVHQIVASWGTPGRAPGELFHPEFIASNSLEFFIIDRGDAGYRSDGSVAFNRMQVFDSTGKFLRGWRSWQGGWDTYVLYQSVIAHDGLLYVTLRGVAGIRVLYEDGRKHNEFAAHSPGWIRSIVGWTTQGFGELIAVLIFGIPEGQVALSAATALLNEHTLAIVDSNGPQRRVQLISITGAFLRSWPKGSSGDHQWRSMTTIGGDIYISSTVTDGELERAEVEVYDRNFRLLRTITLPEKLSPVRMPCMHMLGREYCHDPVHNLVHFNNKLYLTGLRAGIIDVLRLN
jgi:tRNA A-37 threonylcarbamoyl transferase component Bud32